MTSLNGTVDGQKAERAAAFGAGGVLEEPSKPSLGGKSEQSDERAPEEAVIVDDDITEDGGANGERSNEDEAQDGARDLEALAAVPSNLPAYSVFSINQKRFIVFMVAWGGFFSPLSASIYFPALNTLSRELNVSQELINLTLTSYMIFQGLAPTFIGDLADMAGRRPAYIIGFVLYIAACIGIALQDSYAALFVLRCLQSTGSSGTIALGNGVVADIATSAERGTWMGWALSGPMTGPAIGPVLGGILAQFLGWRAIFWFLVIMAAVYVVPFLITFPETGRNVVGNGSIPPQGWNMSLINYLHVRKAAKSDALTRTTSRDEARRAQKHLAKKRKLRFPNPLNTLHVIFEKDVGLLLFYNSLVYTGFYNVSASIPYLFQQIYGFNDLQIGLAFIPFGAGALLAALLFGRLQDWNFRRVATQAGISIDKKRGNDMAGFPIEKVRIQVALPAILVGDAAMLCYGWVLQVETNLAVPLVLQFIIGLTWTAAFNAMSVLLIDLYPLSPSTATAANNLVRCWMGAAGTAIIIQMINGMGRGWCFTFIALVVLATSPILWVLTSWGPKWREERLVRVEERERVVEEKKADVERKRAGTSSEKAASG